MTRIKLLLVFGLIVAVYAVLWSPYWYPASDSALYITLARNLDEGRGYTYMDRPHCQVPPLTPLLLCGSLQISRSFGMVNATIVACMIGGFAFMYLTLKQWLDARTSLALTAASALTYWQFRLAIVPGSDQPFFLIFWAGLLCFAKAYRQPDRRTAWLAMATLLMVLSLGFRIAALLFVPMFVGAMWMEYRQAIPAWPRRLLLVCAVSTPFVLLGGSYWLWGRLVKGPNGPRELVPVPAAQTQAADKPTWVDTSDHNLLPLDDFNGRASPTPGSGANITRYYLTPRLAVADLPTLPGLAGRWIAELLVPPSRVAFTALTKYSQAGLGILILLLAILGFWRHAKAGHWWIVLPVVYMLMIVIMWGFRVIPRYLTPVLPMVLLWVASGCAVTVAATSRLLGTSAARRQHLADMARQAIPILVVLTNLPVLAVELYVQHRGDFYQNIRQGAWAEVVDMAGLIRSNLPPDIVLCTNDPLLRREIHLLTGRAVASTPKLVDVRSSQDEAALRDFFRQTGASHAIIRFCGNKWPEWHLGPNGSSPRSWWGLYRWNVLEARPERISVPANREWVQSLPDSVI